MTETFPVSISAGQAAEWLAKNSNLCIVDVRTPVEFQTVHIHGARNIPLSELNDRAIADLKAQTPGQPLLILCQAGTRGAKACRLLSEAGVTNAVNIEGGTAAMLAAGYPAVRGKQTMSLERQVRVAAGALVCLGVALGLGVHPGFFGIAGFVGAGLVFAGLTDTCGMGMLLAKMPWNRAATCQTKPGK
jgi:rhodanese-related sulfurtransferase